MPESPASSPTSSPRAFDFAELGQPRPSSRMLPPDADASGQLEELSGDDILESDDIHALEAAAADIKSFEAPPSDPSGFEVGELGSFDEVEVEGIAAEAAPPEPPAPAPTTQRTPATIAALSKVEDTKVDAAPVSVKVDYTSPSPSTLIGIPPAPSTSPIPLEESVIVAQPIPERTLEIKGGDMAAVAAAAAKLDAQPDQTEVLVRSAMPPALQTHTLRGGMAAPVQPRPASVSPVAVDVNARTAMPSIPVMTVPRINAPSLSAAPAPRRGLGGLAIGGIVFGAVALIGLVGIGGFAASRALSDKSGGTTLTSAPAEAVATGEAAAAAAAPAPEGNVDPSTASSSPIDVSSLPSAPVPGSAPRGFTGSGSFVAPTTPTPPPLAAAPAAPAAPAAASPAPVGRSSGGALPAPGSGGSSKSVTSNGAAGGPLAAPAAAPAPAPAAAPAQASSTGIVRVDPSLRAVIVDGSYRRANDGALTVACGSHRIKAGMKEQQTVNVPCGGSVSLF